MSDWRGTQLRMKDFHRNDSVQAHLTSSRPLVVQAYFFLDSMDFEHCSPEKKLCPRP